MTTWLEQERKLHPVLNSVKLPARFADPTPAGIKNVMAKAAAKKYLSAFDEHVEQGIGILFSGRSATWKTYTAAYIAQKASTTGALNTLFIQCSLALNHISRQRYTTYHDSKKELDAICTVPFLVMDDFTQVRPRTAVADLLVEIAEARFADQKPTIWTCNLDLSDAEGKPHLKKLSDDYGVSFARRVAHGSRGFLVNII